MAATDEFSEKTQTPPEKTPVTDVEGGAQSQDPLALLARIHSNDDAHPMAWPLWKKWIIVAIYCLLQIFVTLTSTTYVSVEYLIMEKWTGNTQVATLGQSMFIMGTAVGPAFLGMSWSWTFSDHVVLTTNRSPLRYQWSQMGLRRCE